MSERKTTIAELEKSVADLLRELVRRQEELIVTFEEGEKVVIKPLPVLKPLTTFKGYVPDGWKDAIYEP